MSLRRQIVLAAERAFDREGFAATGMDRLVREAGVSSRTLYKHVGSKDALALAVLEGRGERFFAGLPGDRVAGLFDGLGRWIEAEGARGCLFLRAHGEYAARDAAIVALVRRHKARLADEVARRVAGDLGRSDADLARQILILFEGATAAAVHLGPGAATAAGAAADALVALARGKAPWAP
ncbi:MAG: TetR/AcrR family transcriptional regulator [Geminicoccaceae bacterium]|nr:TetR/AcrR family transcriptional regulator [Geminicoccaceae bacterium]